MSRRNKESPPEALFHFLTAMPFWVGPLLAVVVFVVMQFVIPALIETPDPQFSSETPAHATGFGKAILFNAVANFCRLAALWFALGIGIVWLVAETAKRFKPTMKPRPVASAPVSNKMQFADDNSTPGCPKCGSEMIERTARKGANAGSKFLGCSRYPQCRGTRAM